MTDSAVQATPIVGLDSGYCNSTIKDYIVLSKPRIVFLVALSVLVGVMLNPAPANAFIVLAAMLSVILGSAGAAAFNMWYEADMDGMMVRTSQRPIPSGNIDRDSALEYSLFLMVGSVLFALLTSRLCVAVLLLISIISYALLYTIVLKRTTYNSVVFGGLSGAIAPIIGWMSIDGVFSWDAMFLPLVIFCWQPPHSWALGILMRKEYGAVGIPSLPVVSGVMVAKRCTFIYSVLLCFVTTAPLFVPSLGLGYCYIVCIMGLNAHFLYKTSIFCLSPDPSPPREESLAFFKMSVMYLMLVFLIIILDKCVSVVI